MAVAPGSIRDAILAVLSAIGRDASTAEIRAGVLERLGPVPPSSIRSYLNLNVPSTFVRTGRGRYRLAELPLSSPRKLKPVGPSCRIGLGELHLDDCFDWLGRRAPASVHAVVTDPPYGLLEYSAAQQSKLLSGKGGVWRIPPAYDGHKRAPVPRFTILRGDELVALQTFFLRLGRSLMRVLVPGGNVVIASNPLLAHIVAAAMAEAGLEIRGTIVRLTMTMRGGDRPKNAHREFDGVSVMPRSMWEPWVVLRRPLDGRVQDNLRRWKTGGFRRVGSDKPFGDVIRSHPTPRAERLIAPHPSLKPQAFLRQIVRAVLPLGEGVILDPFAGSGSTLAAASAIGLASIGVEREPRFYDLARSAIPALAAIKHALPELDQARPVQRRRPRPQLPAVVPPEILDLHRS